MDKLSIDDILDFIGASPKYNGYKYIIEEAVMMKDLEDKNQKVILFQLFKSIAEKYNTNWTCVEKNTRVCVEGIFKNGNLNHINEIFDNISFYYDDRPSNKLFLTTIVNYLNRNK